MIGEPDALRAKFEAAIAASSLAEHRAYLLSLLRPAIWVKRTAGRPRPGQSKFGGWPDLPADYEWPVHSGGPHEFIAQLNFAEMPGSRNGLPTSGVIFLFAATTPIEHVFWRDPGYISAGYCPADIPCALRQPPPSSAAQIEEQRLNEEAALASRARKVEEVAQRLRWPDYLDEDFSVKLGEFGVQFLPGLDLPRSIEQRDDWPVATREESWQFLDDLHEIWKSVQDGVQVWRGDHLLGYPGQSTLGYDPTPDASWIPFLCLSSHEDLGWCWHDGDYLHLFVRPEKLAQRDFADLACDAG